MTGPAKILAVDDEPDFEAADHASAFASQIRTRELRLPLRPSRRGGAGGAGGGPGDRAAAARHQHAGHGRAHACWRCCAARQSPVRAVIVSAYGDMANIRTAMNRGAFDFVTKPVDLTDLEVTIDKTLESIARGARARPSARRGRAGTRQSRALFLAQSGRDAGRHETSRWGRCDARPWRCCSSTSWASPRMAETHGARAGSRPCCATSTSGWRRRSSPAAAPSRNTSATRSSPSSACPTAEADDAANALRCADCMLDGARRLECRAQPRSGEAALAIGIGLNYGPAVLGDVGSDQGFSFTVIGDTVNTASRLQVLTRNLKTPLVVAGALLERARERSHGRSRSAVGPITRPGRPCLARPQHSRPHLDKDRVGLSQ